ncbi:MAG: class I SAM-dependent methyltransferase [Bacteroidetes bacterium]|nr:class I SAM-dependent methyltransferase [Bacteroidota bacterium]
MPISIFQLLNFILILGMLGALSWYTWGLFTGKEYAPAEWTYARKRKLIPAELNKAFRNYEDKVRFFTFWLQVERLKNEKIEGAFAELGVYKGESARLLHLMDPGRKFHLFDTFQGLPERDLDNETGEAATYTNLNFRDTNIQYVMQKVGGDIDKVLFHVGYFPDSTKGLESECFAFVSIDADLYNPTIAGLSFFYPRLSPGGAILIHDYNHKWEGLQKAVDEFCKGIPEVPFMVPDLEGSILIAKSRNR